MVPLLCLRLIYHLNVTASISCPLSQLDTIIRLRARVCTTIQLTPLLGLLSLLGFPAFTSSLGSLWSRLSVHEVVPPSEAACVVANEAFVVNVVVFSTSPEWEEVMQAPGEFVTTVSVDSLEKTEGDPDVHSQDVEILCEQSPDDRDHDGSSAENHSFNRRSVFSGETEGGGVLMMDLVDASVERTPVHCAVHPVVPCVLQHEEDCDLVGHGSPMRKGDTGVHAASLRHGVEEPDLGELDSEMAEKDEFGAFPLFCGGWDLLVLDLVLVEVWDAIDDDPGETATEVDDFVHEKAHDTGGDHIVLHVCVPALRR
jgi:hypothetical protein